MYLKSSLFFATALVLAASSVSAGITNLQTQTVGTLDIRGSATVGPVINGPSSDYRSDPGGRGAGYAAFSDIDSSLIYFEAGSMSAGRLNGSKSVTEVSFDVSVTEPGEVIDRAISTVFESTFGFYVSDFGEFIDEEMLIEGCTGITLATCGVTTTGSGFDSFGVIGTAGNAGEVAKTSFAFEILYDNVSIRSIGGSISMVRNSDGSISFLEDLGIGPDALATALVSFGPNDIENYAKVYSWGRTPFEAVFADPIEFGETAKITYRITTETSSNAVSIGESTTNMVVGFACFADPKGIGGGKIAEGPPLARVAAFAAAIGNPDDPTCDDFVITGEEEERVYTLTVPEIRDGAVVLGAVPEPATWAMLIAGFGLTGFAARRRRALAA